VDEPIANNLRQSVLKFEGQTVKRLVQESLNMGIPPLETVEVLTNAIREIGEGFRRGDMFLPELMLGAKTVSAGMELLEQEIHRTGLKRRSLGKVVIGTVYGDLHDIGKNIVKTLLVANGFEVIDLGVNVGHNQFVEVVKSAKPDLLAMSALLTTTVSEQRKVIDTLEQAGLRQKLKVMVGGAAVTQEFAESIGADGYEPTAVLAVELANRLVADRA
jgi:corrinoid protein of di/trimethylamine methyltransferase